MPNLSVETLNPDRVRSAVGQRLFEQGQYYFLRGKVKVEEVTDQSAFCFVYGSQTNEVEMKVANKYLHFRCNCRIGYKGVICEHDIAATLAVYDYLRHNQPNRWKMQLNQVLEEARVPPRRSKPRPYLLFFSLQKSETPGLNTWLISPYQLALSALDKELRQSGILSDARQVQDLLETKPELSFFVKPCHQALEPRDCVNCASESVVLANVLLERARAYTYYYTAFPLIDYLALILNTHSPLYLGSQENPLQKYLTVMSQSGELRLEATRDEQGLRLNAKLVLGDQFIWLGNDDVQVISYSPLWMLVDRSLFQVSNLIPGDLLASWLNTPEVVIPKKDETEFLEKYYLPLAEQIPLEGDAVQSERLEVDPVYRLYLSESKEGLQANLRFGYGDLEVEYNPRLPAETLLRKSDSWTLVQIIRQPEKEESVFRALGASTYGLKRAPQPSQPGLFVLRARLHPVDFLVNSVPRLTRDGFEIYGEESLKTARVNRNTPRLTFHVSSGIDWFDVKIEVNFGEQEVSLKEIHRVLRKKERFIKLADGTIGEIPAVWIERYKHLFALGQETSNGVRMAQHHLVLLDQLMQDADQVNTDAEFDRRRQSLRKFSAISSKELPDGFSGELRPYQKAGYDWLHFLHDYEFGGCLADDMGLGKTVQVLVFLQSLKEGVGSEHRFGGVKPPERASLAVVPRSLLVNWQREAGRFTPNLRLLVYFDKDRIKDTSTFDQVDLVLTTYGVMLRDIAVLKKYPFHVILLDESQTIKNPLAQTARAARLLEGRRRLVLTGTPVENSTLELWSQFAFLNPGLLGNLEYFKSEFSTPIEKKADEQAAQLLRKMVYPFILRRTKDQVAPELPPRTERILYCDMDPAQRKFYERTREYYRGMLLGMLEAEGMNNSRMKILEGLLRLRQISNHPRLVDGKFRGESGKFELLLETLETLRVEGHKALVFSQFVQMLRLVQAPLDSRKIPYAYLDGHTRNRQEVVDTFQIDPHIPFFLISLKAGGVGLNLTAADYVIHIDPWWNPAVEMQAADRTHRIGQEKPVFIYKLITRDSVEEKILLLQERKKNLVDQLITTESSFFKSLRREDVEILFSV